MLGAEIDLLREIPVLDLYDVGSSLLRKHGSGFPMESRMLESPARPEHDMNPVADVEFSEQFRKRRLWRAGHLFPASSHFPV